MDEIRKVRNILNPFNKASVYYTPKTISTMKLAEEHCSLSDPQFPLSGTVFMAGMQTAGRGRVPGRVWEALKDNNLLFTLILDRADTGGNPLPIVVGLGISKYLEKYHNIKSTIKWPNDIIVDGRKIAGIIIESGRNFFNIGIGININQKKFPDLLLRSATSLAIEKNLTFDLFSELELILHQLKETLIQNSWHNEISSRLYNPGDKVSISTGIPGQEKIITGIIEGIGTAGQLLLTSEGSLCEIFSGEIKQ